MERRTKIICTIGPATDSLDNLIKLIETGMDAARLNFSHSTQEYHLKTIQNIREASRITNKPVTIIQDLQGPKIRTGMVQNDKVLLMDNSEFIITIEDIEIGDEKRVSTTYKNLVKEIKAGNTILLDDGYIILSVTNVDSQNVYCNVVKGGFLKNNKGIIAPGVSSSAPSLSEKDLEDLRFGLNAGVDMVALSFVRSERDVVELKTAMKIFGRVTPVIAKIERYEGIEDIEDIVNESDAIMVARGDLGLELPPENVPVLQKEIIDRCNFYGKPVIIATQMLESMIGNPRPTRAEASDVANAVIDGADCVMLSGETSVGKYPFDAVNYMDRIIRAVEERYNKNKKELFAKTANLSNDALSKASCVVAEQIEAKAILTLTTSGNTAKNIAKYRPNIPIVALTCTNATLNEFGIVWGVKGMKIPDELFHEKFNFVKLTEIVKSKYGLKPDCKIVFIARNSVSIF